jgi:hypothetical protein
MGSFAQGGGGDINEGRCIRGPWYSGKSGTYGSFKQQDLR